MEPKDTNPKEYTFTATMDQTISENDFTENFGFDRALGEHLIKSMRRGDAIPTPEGVRALTVEITLQEYRALCRAVEQADAANEKYWTMCAEYEKRIKTLQEEKAVLQSFHAIIKTEEANT